jgi:hypothetical protein
MGMNTIRVYKVFSADRVLQLCWSFNHKWNFPTCDGEVFYSRAEAQACIDACNDPNEEWEILDFKLVPTNREVELACYEKGCQETLTVYLGPGAGGEECYAYDKDGKYLADMRDQVFYCEKHMPT